MGASLHLKKCAVESPALTAGLFPLQSHHELSATAPSPVLPRIGY